MAIHFPWICSIMKICIIWCVPAQIFYLGKILLLRYNSKWSQPLRLQDLQINHFSRTNRWHSHIFSVFIQIHKNKSWSKSFRLSMVENVHGQSLVLTLKLTTSKEWNDRVDWFFASWYNFTQIKWLKIFQVSMVKNEQALSVCWQDSKIDCIWRMSRWNKPIFCMLTHDHKN